MGQIQARLDSIVDENVYKNKLLNAMAESVIGLYKLECVGRDGPFRGVDDLELATLSWVDWFNNHRLHSMIGNVPPIEYEAVYYRQNPSVQQSLAGELCLH